MERFQQEKYLCTQLQEFVRAHALSQQVLQWFQTSSELVKWIDSFFTPASMMKLPLSVTTGPVPQSQAEQQIL